MKDRIYSPINQVLDTSPLEMEAGSAALLVVDMQYFDADRDEGEGRTAKELGVERYFEEYFAQIDAVIPRIQHLLALFRQKGIEVIHIRVSELTEDSRDVGRKQLVRGFVVPAGSREADFLDDLQPVGDELIVNKSSSGVFPVTNLDRLLRNLGITILVFTGTSTNGCVESAVRDAVDLGYEVVIVSDACAAGTLDTHNLALSCLAGARTHILSTDQVVGLIEPQETVASEGKSGLERVKPFLPKSPDETDSADRDPYDAILPPALQLPLTQDNSALVLVDGQRFTCDPSLGLGARAAAQGRGESLSAYYARVQSALVGMECLLHACRAHNVAVIHIRTAGRLPDGRDLSPKVRAQGFAFGPASPEAEFMPGVVPAPGEIVLDKPASGIFTGTGLDELLRNLALENLILAGISYDGAIEGSIRSTSDRGYGLVVVPDACATSLDALQEFLWTVESGVIQVKSVEETVAQIASF